MKARNVGNAGKKLKHLNVFVTRHGKTMIYFRHRGRNVQILADPQVDYAAFLAEYQAALNGDARPAQGATRSKGGTWSALIETMMRSPEYLGLAKNTRRNTAAVIRLLRGEWGDRAVADITRADVRNAVDFVVKRGVGENPDLTKDGNFRAAGNQMLVLIRKLVKIALDSELIDRDPTVGIDKLRTASEGFRPWRDDEVAQWQATHAIGTPARLVMETIYATGLRGRSDVTRLAPEHIVERDGKLWLSIIPQKTSKGGESARVERPIGDFPDLIACLKAAAPEGNVVDLRGASTTPFLRQRNGKPYDETLFSLHWQQWRAAAGLPEDFTAHGGRKLLVVDMMDAGIPTADGMVLTGHKNDAVYKHYGAKRSKQAAAERAAKVVATYRGRQRAG